MNKKEKTNRIISYIEKLYPDAHCELNYFSDYSLIIAVMLSAQTTDKSVNKVTKKLFEKYHSLEDLQNAKLEDIENCIRTIGLYKNKAKYTLEIAKALYKHGQITINDEEYLLTLPGVGIKTRNVVFAELFNSPFLAVDTHVKRVSIRLQLVNKSDSPLIIEQKLEKIIPIEKRVFMHHGMIFFGRYFCKATNPLCYQCELHDLCKHKDFQK